MIMNNADVVAVVMQDNQTNAHLLTWQCSRSQVDSATKPDEYVLI